MDPILSISYATIAKFFEAAEGNYRNALYIECKCCTYQKVPGCGHFLFIPDYDCRPLLLPLSDVEHFISRKVDPSECAGIINNITFCKLYHKWLELNTRGGDECPIHQMLFIMNQPQNW